MKLIITDVKTKKEYKKLRCAINKELKFALHIKVQMRCRKYRYPSEINPNHYRVQIEVEDDFIFAILSYIKENTSVIAFYPVGNNTGYIMFDSDSYIEYIEALNK